MPAFTGWGAAAWGSSAWGGGSGSDLQLLDAVAISENRIRLEFSKPVYFSRLLEPADASSVDKYAVSAVAGTSGMDDTAVRAVAPATIELPNADFDQPVDAAGLGRFVDVVLDRPMTPYPALYNVSVSGIFSDDLVDVLDAATFQLFALFRQLQEPIVDAAVPSRDIANPTGLEALAEADPHPNDAAVLGTFRVDDSGDYAADEGSTNLKKRVVRRGITEENGFAHLPGYGAGIASMGKKLAIASVLIDKAANYESQISREPDVARARVTASVDPANPGLAKFSVVVKPKAGKPQAFDVPFKISDQ